jgi:hypothetical protein
MRNVLILGANGQIARFATDLFPESLIAAVKKDWQASRRTEDHVSREPVTVKRTFVDLRGNKYPTNETTFKPLSLPTVRCIALSTVAAY